MTSWQPDLTGRSGPRYQALAEAIAEAVRTGALAPGAKLPPQRELAWKLGVTVGTVGRAYALAEEQQLVSGQVGRGTYVLEPGVLEPGALEPGARRVEPIEPQLDSAEQPGGIIDMTRNIPAVTGQAMALAHSLAAIGQRPGLNLMLDYMPVIGHRAYRVAGARWIERTGLEIPPERLMVVGGAQHALATAVVALARPGEAVLTEHITYHGVANAMRLAGARPVGVAMDAEGALPASIDQAARETGAKLVFLTPTIHSPTTANMSEERRRAIAEVLRARDLVLIEDDVYGYLPEHRPPPIAALVPERALYISSTSKCLAPGLRMAWLGAPPALFDRLADTLHAMALALPAFGAEIVTRWIADGTADRLVKALREETAARHALAGTALAGLQWRGRPDSMHAFVTLPDARPVAEFAAEAARRGIAICAAGDFAVDDTPAPNAFRIALGSTATRPVMQRAVATLAEMARTATADSAVTMRRLAV